MFLVTWLQKNTAQIRALVNKSFILQFRQYATNLCQFAFPIIIIVFIFILQLILNVIFVLPDPIDVAPPATQLAPVLLNFLNLPRNFSNIPYRFLMSTAPNVNNESLGFLSSTRQSAGLLSGIGIGTGGQLPFTNSAQPGATTFYIPYWDRVSDPFAADDIFFDKLNRFGSRQPLTEISAYHFWSLNLTRDQDASLGYDVQFDDTDATTFCRSIIFFGGCKGLVPSAMMSYMNSLFIRNITNNQQYVTTLTKQMPYRTKPATFAIADLIGSFFFPLVLSFLLPVFMYTLVLEKQGKLKEMMKLTGLNEFNYVFVNYVFFYLFYLIILAEFLILCTIFQFRAITQTHPLVSALGYLGWGLCLVSWSFFLSAFIGKTLVAVVIGYLLTIFGNTAGTILESFVFEKGNYAYKAALLINPLPLTQFISAITGACNRLTCPGLESLWLDPEIQMSISFMYFNAFVYLVLGLYIEAVLPQQWGIAKPWYFPIAWLWSCCKRHSNEIPKSVGAFPEYEDEDVIEERRKVLSGEKTPENSPVVIQSLHKRYNRRKIAVHELTVAMDKNECFGLLGPNGAGKSTSISILCGLFGPTYGTAYVNGFDIRTEMDSVHLSLGLCPQFDILWDDLTCFEHLLFYARLKGTPILEEEAEVRKVLESVGLWDRRDKRAGKLSGGMKRRLSIAISFVGNPSIVMLDEPTTGLDPTSKRNLWDAILAQRANRCIILTTHSMEEADVLCNRIGIVCRGRLKCVGSSLHLKNKYGEGFTLSVNFKEGRREDSIKYIASILPQAKLTLEFKGNIVYEIEKQYVKVSKIFKDIESGKDDSGIHDWALSQTTLEDVFLNIVKKDEDDYFKELEQEKKMLGLIKEKGMEIPDDVAVQDSDSLNIEKK